MNIRFSYRWHKADMDSRLAHCHIGWHTSEGFALQFVERIHEIAGQYNETALRTSCDKWFAYDEAVNLEQHDSGV